MQRAIVVQRHARAAGVVILLDRAARLFVVIAEVGRRHVVERGLDVVAACPRSAAEGVAIIHEVARGRTGDRDQAILLVPLLHETAGAVGARDHVPDAVVAKSVHPRARDGV